VNKDESTASSTAATHDQRIRVLVARLGRPHASGGTVIERAALLAEGRHFHATLEWILANGGQPESSGRGTRSRGLYGSASDASASEGTPQRFVLPAGALTGSPGRDAPTDDAATGTPTSRVARLNSATPRRSSSVG
jgi:hypothetical protein